MAPDKERVKDYIARFDKLAQSAYAEAAYNAVVSHPSDRDAFTQACIDAECVSDDQAGKDIAKKLFKIAKKIIHDTDWGWD
jgi:hypothetical protein